MEFGNSARAHVKMSEGVVPVASERATVAASQAWRLTTWSHRPTRRTTPGASIPIHRPDRSMYYSYSRTLRLHLAESMQ